MKQCFLCWLVSYHQPDLNVLLEENKKLKQQLKIAEMEREFLKKAAAYFAKESQ